MSQRHVDEVHRNLRWATAWYGGMLLAAGVGAAGMLPGQVAVTAVSLLGIRILWGLWELRRAHEKDREDLIQQRMGELRKEREGG